VCCYQLAVEVQQREGAETAHGGHHRLRVRASQKGCGIEGLAQRRTSQQDLLVQLHTAAENGGVSGRQRGGSLHSTSGACSAYVCASNSCSVSLTPQRCVFDPQLRRAGGVWHTLVSAREAVAWIGRTAGDTPPVGGWLKRLPVQASTRNPEEESAERRASSGFHACMWGSHRRAHV